MHAKFLLPMIFVLTGCVAVQPGTEAHLLVPGEAIRIDYTCQTPEGALVASTDTSAPASGQTLSPIFIQQKVAQAKSYTVPDQVGSIAVEQTMPMEEKIERYLLRQAAGKPAGENVELTIQGEVFAGEGGDRYLPMRRKFWKKRRVAIPKNAYERSFGCAPEVGLDKETKISGLSAKVLAITGDQVEVLYSAKPGTHLFSIFGDQTVTQTDEKLEMYTEAREGALLRTSTSLIGKITDVTAEGFVVDYGHAFGFTPLTCQTVFTTVSPSSDK